MNAFLGSTLMKIKDSMVSLDYNYLTDVKTITPIQSPVLASSSDRVLNQWQNFNL